MHLDLAVVLKFNPSTKQASLEQSLPFSKVQKMVAKTENTLLDSVSFLSFQQYCA